ncbi:hypothetical protein TcWFU_006718 [Taenia crassiceps]|uniref:Heat shock protein 70 n=1 Tax=Taenia crassiceps TaxID=6207 RepID=A0ABR4QIG7_9CEST
MLLSRLREVAEERMERRVNTTFISVPACLNRAQRGAIVNTAEIAGFYGVHLLNETTAASIAYAASNTVALEDSKNVVFCDLGGGHVSVLVKRLDKLLDVEKTGLSASMKNAAKRRFSSKLAGNTSAVVLKERRRHLEKITCNPRLTTRTLDVHLTEMDRDYVHSYTATLFTWLSRHQQTTLAEVENKIREVTEIADLLY